MRTTQRALAMMAIGGLFLAGCASDEPVGVGAGAQGEQDRPVVVATTNILGDVLVNLVGGQFEVVTIMPVGSDPHDFQPSAQDVAAIADASAIIVNGAAFEEGLLDAVEAAEADGVPVFEAISAVAALDFDDAEDDDHGDEDHDDDHGDEDHDDDHGDEDDEDHDEEHGGHDEHDHAGGVDPHFFTDPARMADAADGIVDFLIANVNTVDAAELRADADSYIDELSSLDEEVKAVLASVPESQRVLVTNHEVFGYFAERYDFEVVATVIPTGSSTDVVSGQRLAELAELLESEGVAAVFADTSASDQLAQTLAAEVGDVAVVELFSESLGDDDSDGATYLDMVRSNATRMAEALAP